MNRRATRFGRRRGSGGGDGSRSARRRDTVAIVSLRERAGPTAGWCVAHAGCHSGGRGRRARFGCYRRHNWTPARAARCAVPGDALRTAAAACVRDPSRRQPFTLLWSAWAGLSLETFSMFVFRACTVNFYLIQYKLNWEILYFTLYCTSIYRTCIYTRIRI